MSLGHYGTASESFTFLCRKGDELFEESRPGCMTQGMMRQRAALGRSEAMQSSRLDQLMPIG